MISQYLCAWGSYFWPGAHQSFKANPMFSRCKLGSFSWPMHRLILLWVVLHHEMRSYSAYSSSMKLHFLSSTSMDFPVHKPWFFSRCESWLRSRMLSSVYEQNEIMYKILSAKLRRPRHHHFWRGFGTRIRCHVFFGTSLFHEQQNHRRSYYHSSNLDPFHYRCHTFLSHEKCPTPLPHHSWRDSGSNQYWNF